MREFLERVADQIQQMEAMIREARLEAEAALHASAEPRIDPYHQLSSRFADVIRSADETAERVRREAREDAERMLAEARADADRVRTDAQTKAEEARASADRALREAREQADRTIAGLSTRRESLFGQLAQMRERLLGVAEQLESAIEIRDEAGARSSTIVIGEAAAPADELFSPPGGPAPAGSSAAEAATVAAGYEDLWEGIGTIELEVPEIPPLDLWGDADEDD